MEPTSEQELRQLLNEGKITEQEYQELLEAIRQKETVQKPVEKPNELKPRPNYGKMALSLMLLGFLLPLASWVLNIIMAMQVTNGSTPRMMMFSGCPFLFLGFLCLLLAFIFGIIGWKTTQGKIAAIGVPCLGLLIVPGLLLLGIFVHRPVIVEKPEAVSMINHKAYPLDSLDSIITEQDGVEFDEISTDGNGSLKITSDLTGKRVVRLFETGPMSIEDCMLIYSAKIRTEKLYGKTYLEMWCDIPGKGEFFSRNIEQPITGTTVVWTTAQTPFRLEGGQSPANVKLNLVIEGVGTVWVDDIKLLSNPLD